LWLAGVDVIVDRDTRKILRAIGGGGGNHLQTPQSASASCGRSVVVLPVRGRPLPPPLSKRGEKDTPASTLVASLTLFLEAAVRPLTFPIHVVAAKVNALAFTLVAAAVDEEHCHSSLSSAVTPVLQAAAQGHYHSHHHGHSYQRSHAATLKLGPICGMEASRALDAEDEETSHFR